MQSWHADVRLLAAGRRTKAVRAGVSSPTQWQINALAERTRRRAACLLRYRISCICFLLAQRDPFCLRVFTRLAAAVEPRRIFRNNARGDDSGASGKKPAFFAANQEP
jgi:hypothetical protein